MDSANQPLLIIALVVVVVTALAINYYFHKRQEAENTRRLLSKQLKGQIEQVLDSLAVLKQTSCDPQLITALTDYSMGLFTQLKTVNPQSDLAAQLEKGSGRSSEPALQLKSDQSIRQAQQSIRNATSVLSKLRQQGKLTPVNASELVQELNWFYYQIEADAHIDQAGRLIETGKNSVAITHLKQARTAISKTSSKDPRRTEKIRELNAAITDADPFTKKQNDPEATQT